MGNKKRKLKTTRKIPTSVAVKYINDFLIRMNELPQTSESNINIAHDVIVLLFFGTLLI